MSPVAPRMRCSIGSNGLKFVFAGPNPNAVQSQPETSTSSAHARLSRTAQEAFRIILNVTPGSSATDRRSRGLERTRHHRAEPPVTGGGRHARPGRRLDGMSDDDATLAGDVSDMPTKVEVLCGEARGNDLCREGVGLCKPTVVRMLFAPSEGP